MIQVIKELTEVEASLHNGWIWNPQYNDLPINLLEKDLEWNDEMIQPWNSKIFYWWNPIRWFSNNSITEKDKESLRKQIKDKVERLRNLFNQEKIIQQIHRLLEAKNVVTGKKRWFSSVQYGDFNFNQLGTDLEMENKEIAIWNNKADFSGWLRWCLSWLTQEHLVTQKDLDYLSQRITNQVESLRFLLNKETIIQSIERLTKAKNVFDNAWLAPQYNSLDFDSLGEDLKWSNTEIKSWNDKTYYWWNPIRLLLINPITKEDKTFLREKIDSRHLLLEKVLGIQKISLQDCSLSDPGCFIKWGYENPYYVLTGIIVSGAIATGIYFYTLPAPPPPPALLPPPPALLRERSINHVLRYKLAVLY